MVNCLLRTILWLVLLALSGHSSAACVVNGGNTIIDFPAVLNVPRDAKAGTLLTNWVRSSRSAEYFHCKKDFSHELEGLYFSSSGMMTPSDLTISRNGSNYKVYNTGHPGVGIAVEVDSTIGNCPNTGPYPLGVFLKADTAYCAISGYFFTKRGGLSAALVKTGPIASGVIEPRALVKVQSIFVNDKVISVEPGSVTFSIRSIAIAAQSCRTPNIEVRMGAHTASAFKGRGSSSRPVPFSLRFEACPAGLSSVSYRFDAPDGVIDKGHGVIALSDPSTAAAGIGLQLMDGTGAALDLGKSYTATTGPLQSVQDIDVGFRAAYVQTGDRVRPGTANAVLKFTMTYQ